MIARAAVALLLAGPTALAFFSGGYFDQPRLWAGVLAWALVAVAVLCRCSPLPGSGPGRLALGSLLLLTLWVGLSTTWAPLSEAALDDFERTLLYVAALAAAAALLRGETLRWVEPAVAGGVLVVVGYGLAGRLLPGIMELTESATAAGRLEQPLTYWNAMGALAAIGFVLCVRLAGDPSRGDRLRVGAVAAGVPLGLGVYLSFSRGAIAALLLGLAVVLVLAPDWRQLRAAALTLGGSLAVSVAVAALPGVRALEGSAGTRQKEGLIALAVLALAAGGAAAVQLAFVRREQAGNARTGRLLGARHGAAIGTGLAVLVLGGAALGTALERGPNPVSPATGAKNERLTSTESNRYAYWRVAFGEFADHPIEGSGSGGFRVAWLKEREIEDPAQDAHSLYIETAAELGLVGVLLLALFLGGVAAVVRGAYRVAPGATAGLAAGSAVWAMHAALDWDWEMPAVTLPALILAGALIALADQPSG